MSIDVVKLVVVGLGWLPAVVFVVLFAWLEPWWRTPFGRHIMGYSTIVAVFLSLALAVNAGIPVPYLDQLLLVLYATLALLIWQRLALLIGAHWRARRDNTSAPTQTEPGHWRNRGR